MAHVHPITKILSLLQLRPVKKIKFIFDPFGTKVRSIRETLFLLQSSKISKTNLSCQFIVDVKSDRSSPVMDVHFSDGEKLKFKTENLKLVEIIEHLNKFCTEKDPKKEDTTTDFFKTR